MKVRELVRQLVNYDMDDEVKLKVGDVDMTHVGTINRQTDDNEPDIGPIVVINADV